MKKKILIMILLFQIGIVFGQVCVKSGNIYKSSGLEINYCIESLGSELNCKKWKVHFYFRNLSKIKIDISGSKIHIFNDVPQFPPANTCSVQDIELQFPWNRQNIGATEMNPGYNESSSIIAYSNKEIPRVEGVIVLRGTTATGEWTDWKSLSSGDCESNLQYCTKRVETYNFNYQLWFYYKVRNNNNKQVSLIFKLNKDGKKEFSQPHTLNPGEVQEFMHKMSGDYINGVGVEKFIFTDTKKSVCDKSENNENANSSSNSSSSQSNMQELLNNWNELCQKAGNSTNPNVISAKGRSCLTAAKNFDDTAANRNMIATKIKDLESAFATDNDFEKEQEKAKKAEEERLQAQSKVWVQKTSDFTNFINEGDTELNNRNYDASISKYNEAKNLYSGNLAPQEEAYAKDAIPLANARIAAAEQAKRNAAREERLEKQKERDQKEDLAYTAAATGMLGAMALVNDRYTHKVSSGKLQFGLGYEQTPMITNQNNSYAPLASYADKASYPTLFMALKLEFLNNKPVNLNLRGLYSLGIQAFDTGVSGGHVVTGFDGGIQFWYTTHTKFKLFADFGSYTRVGERIKDQDAINSGTTATDDVREGEYNYKVFRYGGGPMFHTRHDGKETWIKAGMFLEKISFAENAKKTMCFSLSANIESEIIVEFNYSKNYPIAGKINYPTTFTTENQNYFSIKLIRQGNLW